MPVIWQTLAQHVEGSGHLWCLRSGALCWPHFALDDLARLDLRLDANLDGLRISGESGWTACRDALGTGGVGEAFALAVLAFESRRDDRTEYVLSAVLNANELSDAVVSALGWLDFSCALPYIAELLASSQPMMQKIGIGASVVHANSPGPLAARAFSSGDPLLRARALRMVGELSLLEYEDELQRHAQDEHELCRFWAAWSRLRLSYEQRAMETLISFAERDSPLHIQALQTAIRRMNPSSAGEWLRRLLRNDNSIRRAIAFSGNLGDPVNIATLIEQMQTPELARVAGEAFTMITGVDIAYEDLDRKRPDDFEAGPNEDPKDDNVEMDPDEHLPWPDPELIAAWWHKNRHRFQSGTRYLLGNPITPDWCRQVLRIGRQRQRAAAALELAILEPGTPLFNVAAPGFRQQEMLGLRRRRAPAART